MHGGFSDAWVMPLYGGLIGLGWGGWENIREMKNKQLDEKKNGSKDVVMSRQEKECARLFTDFRTL